MKKRFLFVLLALAVAVTALVGCGNEEAFEFSSSYCRKLNKKIASASYNGLDLTVTTDFGDEDLIARYAVEKESETDGTINYSVEKFAKIIIDEESGEIILPENFKETKTGVYHLEGGTLKDEAGETVEADFENLDALKFAFSVGVLASVKQIDGGMTAEVTDSKNFCGITDEDGESIKGMTVTVIENQMTVKKIVLNYSMDGASITYEYVFR